MTAKEIIESGLLEAYVLGNATADEVAQVNRFCQQYPELIAEIEAIERTLMDHAASQVDEVPAGLKNRIEAQLNLPKSPEAPKVLPLKKDKRIRLYRFGLAASLLLFVSSLVYNVRLQTKVDNLNMEIAALSSSQSYMAQEMQIQKASYDRMETELAIAGNPKMKKVALNGMNSLANHMAVIHWNTETKEVYFNAGVMAAPQGKQYQLWAIVDGKPVDAGMIDADGTDIFQKMKTIPSAQAFAVTIEKVGGSETPSLETMCLLGNV